MNEPFTSCSYELDPPDRKSSQICYPRCCF